MEKIFSVQLSGLPRMAKILDGGVPFSDFRLGRIEKVLESGRFVVVLENGTQVTAEGSQALKVGNCVRVFPPSGVSWKVGKEQELPPPALNESGTLWTAFLPLGFGGKKSSVRLQTFVDTKIQRGIEKGSRAVYFVLWTRTEKLGEIQWCIYLKGRQISIQVFAGGEGFDKQGSLKNLAIGIEKNLKGLGFVLAVPTVFLPRPFRIPEGFRLNIKG
jgi:hypothetical protein